MKRDPAGPPPITPTRDPSSRVIWGAVFPTMFGSTPGPLIASHQVNWQVRMESLSPTTDQRDSRFIGILSKIVRIAKTESMNCWLADRSLAGEIPGRRTPGRTPFLETVEDFAPGLPVANKGRPGDLRSYTVLYSDSVMRAKNIRSGWIAGFAKSVSKYRNDSSNRFFAPRDTIPYRFGRR